MGTGGPFPRVKRDRGVTLTTHPHLVMRSWMSRSYTSSPPQAPPWRLEGRLYFTYNDTQSSERNSKINSRNVMFILSIIFKNMYNIPTEVNRSHQWITTCTASTTTTTEAEAVPLHVMEAHGGRGVYLLLIHDLGTRWGWVVSVRTRPRFTPGERTPGTHCAGGWVGPRASLDTEATGKILCPRRGSNPDRWSSSPWSDTILPELPGS
jgi:hypothetical protein